MTVLPPLFSSTTHLSSLDVTLQTASHGFVNSLTNDPVLRSQSFTLPSFPPLTMKRSLDWRQVTELLCARSLKIHSKVERSKTMTLPSEPPVTRMELVSLKLPNESGMASEGGEVVAVVR
jgi:hypothetical protein